MKSEKLSFKELLDATSTIKKLAIAVSAFLLACGTIYATSIAVIAAADKHFLSLDEPKFNTIFDMLEFSMQKQGTWDGYEQHLRDQKCQEKFSRGEPCIFSPSNPTPTASRKEETK